jgi:hypothetical protein
LIDPDPEACFLILYQKYNYWLDFHQDIRCREKWVEYGEKNNSYFLGLEKQRQIKKSINKLINENNEIITDQMHILSN